MCMTRWLLACMGQGHRPTSPLTRYEEQAGLLAWEVQVDARAWAMPLQWCRSSRVGGNWGDEAKEVTARVRQ